jgi:hypothetical protein
VVSRLRELLTLPSGIKIPDELDRAWEWMEQQGWHYTREDDCFLTPYPGDRQLGIVFSNTGTLKGWDALEDSPQLAPLAEIGSDGSIAALWRSDDGRLRFVGLGSEGDAYLLAETAVDFLRLIAVGYRELTAPLGLPDEDADDLECIEALADFRAWVEGTFNVSVPASWPPLDEQDEFADWVDAANGVTAPAEVEAPHGLPAGVVAGDVTVLLDALGENDGAQRLADMLGLPDATLKSLRSVGIDFSVKRGTVKTIWVDVVPKHGPSYPRPGHLIDGVAPTASVREVITRLGEPERQSPKGVLYVIGGRYLHLRISDRGITQLTTSVSW